MFPLSRELPVPDIHMVTDEFVTFVTRFGTVLGRRSHAVHVRVCEYVHHILTCD
jgi:hypothetical protein